jgi:hypothetical protein
MGLHVNYLRPDPQSPYYSSTGSLVISNDKLCRLASKFDSLDPQVLQTLDKSLWQLLRSLFVMKNFRRFVATCSATHAYQLLYILLFNRIHLEQNDVSPLLGSFYLRNITSFNDLSVLIDDYFAYSVIYNVLNDKRNKHNGI